MTLSTHVLDTETGRPAAGIRVTAECFANEVWLPRGDSVTDADGRASQLVAAADWVPGRWRLLVRTEDHHGAQAFYPQVTIEFAVPAPAEHHHIPLLLSRHGYTTYRGS